MDELIDIFKANPFYLISPIDNYNHHIGQFKKYGFTKQETIRILKEVGGVMGLNRGAVEGIFNLGKYFLNCYLNSQKFTRSQSIAYEGNCIEISRNITSTEKAPA
jgi:hypothetical protein